MHYKIWTWKTRVQPTLHMCRLLLSNIRSRRTCRKGMEVRDFAGALPQVISVR